MNRKRCPWCGNRIHKDRDAICRGNVTFSPSVPRMLRIADCGHCGRKYGQVPIFPYALMIDLVVVLGVVLALILQSGWLFVAAFVPCILFLFMPYSKLDDKGKHCQANTDLLCKMVIIDKYRKIKRYELYFLEDDFDGYIPFAAASPIDMEAVSRKGNIASGVFLYRHEKNGD